MMTELISNVSKTGRNPNTRRAHSFKSFGSAQSIIAKYYPKWVKNSN
jgi:hypothetical protein